MPSIVSSFKHQGFRTPHPSHRHEGIPTQTGVERLKGHSEEINKSAATVCG